jgi:hypothetical protein
LRIGSFPWRLRWPVVSRVTDPTTAPAYLKRCIQGALIHWLRDRALLVRLPAAARAEATWKHHSLDQPLAGIGGSWLDGLAAPESTSPEAGSGLDQGLEALVEQLPTAQAAALRLGSARMTVQRAQQKALASLREQVTARGPCGPAPLAGAGPRHLHLWGWPTAWRRDGRLGRPITERWLVHMGWGWHH